MLTDIEYLFSARGINSNTLVEKGADKCRVYVQAIIRPSFRFCCYSTVRTRLAGAVVFS